MSLPYLCIPIDKNALGLGNVDNTSDVNKPVSTAQAAADAAVLASANAYTDAAIGGLPAAPVTSVAGKTGNVTLVVADVSGAAPLASPTFTGTVVLPGSTSIGGISSTELSYLDNVSSNIQVQLSDKQPLNANLTSYANAANAAQRRTLIGAAALNGSSSVPFSTSGLSVSGPLGVLNDIDTDGNVLVHMGGNVVVDSGEVSTPSVRTDTLYPKSGTEIIVDGKLTSNEVQTGFIVSGVDGSNVISVAGRALIDDNYTNVAEWFNAEGRPLLKVNDLLQVVGQFSSDNNSIASDGSGVLSVNGLTAAGLAVTGQSFFDNGAISTDGTGTLSANGAVFGGRIYINDQGNGNINTDGPIFTSGELTAEGVTVLDAGAITTDGSGNLSANEIIANNLRGDVIYPKSGGTVTLDGGLDVQGLLTVTGDVSFSGSSTASAFYLTSGDSWDGGGLNVTTGNTRLDNGAITTDGGGGLTASEVTVGNTLIVNGVSSPVHVISYTSGNVTIQGDDGYRYTFAATRTANP